jgi:hypothetical protein
MEIQHLTLTSERDARLPLFPDEGTYLEALRRIGAVCQGCLALFALIAEHLHLIAVRSRAAAGRLAQSVLVSLNPIVGTPLAPSHIKAVETRQHMRSLLRYILEQPKEHRMPGHPALWVGSCFPDLVGARTVDGLSLCIEQVLPDFSPAVASRIVGLPGRSLMPADRITLRRAGAHRLKQAAAAAVGVDAALTGRSRPTLRARRAAAQLAERAGIHLSEISAALDHCPGMAFRLRTPIADRELLATIARRITLEDLVRESVQPAV